MLPPYYSHKNIFIIIINISDNYSFAQRSAHTSAIRYQIKKGTLTGALHFTKSGLFVRPARAVLAGARLSLAADSSLVLLGTARCASCVALPFVGLLVEPRSLVRLLRFIRKSLIPRFTRDRPTGVLCKPCSLVSPAVLPN